MGLQWPGNWTGGASHALGRVGAYHRRFRARDEGDRFEMGRVYNFPQGRLSCPRRFSSKLRMKCSTIGAPACR